ncbi:hypothetical protein AnigIFM59636_011960 [Aspergillus niger]|uniref:Contig An15c0010, genomic contig n=2 Tax=Aspergillus niger TaxID=5061 RepID=A5ABV1_ASPNC|nr:uncharacterized protein An15g00040 [Aspergillus niger]GKZ97207.1 hypothetical protein AnigIFM59636_011960 [Aspergillus niger]GLA43691.1 hypothetical protein AnigIFM63309_001622 [Aspergillus niger]CAK42173.1 unnamed protein product [Aspergillus niger]
MAKSVRASVSKRNRAKLRATVFGPAVDARTERLSAKLQELASQPRPNEEKPSMELDNATTDNSGDKVTGNVLNSTGEMDIDQGTAKGGHAHTRKSGRIQKRHKKSLISYFCLPGTFQERGRTLESCDSICGRLHASDPLYFSRRNFNWAWILVLSGPSMAAMSFPSGCLRLQGYIPSACTSVIQNLCPEITPQVPFQ